jgi:hypothetical protein
MTIRHIVRCRADDWQISGADAQHLEASGAIWLDHNATARSEENRPAGDPVERVYGVTGEDGDAEESSNIEAVSRAERALLAK